jgi:inhibitor of KinA
LTSDYLIFPLGDTAATIDFGNSISPALNQKVLALQHWLQQNAFEGLKDSFVAYSSLTVVYDPVVIKKQYNPETTIFEFVTASLHEAYRQATLLHEHKKDIITIPVCYDADLGIDLATFARSKNFSPDAVIDIHTSRTYRVYMIGFLPGFSYMGEVDEQLVAPRKAQPVPVMAGSVGVAGVQTGIYPLNSPGGWHILGRTPVKLFNKEATDPVLLHAGDEVRFYSIRREEFEYGEWN